MPIVQGAIHGTHINVARSSNPFLEEYFMDKINGYNVATKCIIYEKKYFIDIPMCLIVKLVKYSRMLHKSSSYQTSFFIAVHSFLFKLMIFFFQNFDVASSLVRILERIYH
jgi:hypothetical protein